MRLFYRNETEINQQSDKMKLLDYDENYLAELKEEKETLSKNVKENSHTLRLLENGKSSCKSFVWEPVNVLFTSSGPLS